MIAFYGIVLDNGNVETFDSLSPPVLEYAHGDTIATEQLHWRIIRCVVLLPGIVVPFVSFTYSTTPADAISETFRDIAVNHSPESYHWLFVLAVGLAWPPLMWVLAARLLLPLRVRIWECRVSIVAAGMLAIAGLTFCCWGTGVSLHEQTSLHPSEWAAFLASPVMLGMTTPLLVLRWRTLTLSKVAILCQHVAYLSVASIALLAFLEDRDPGWWITLGLCGCALGELALSLRPR